MAESIRVADLSEDELLARIVPLLPGGVRTLLGPGDDAAVLAAPDGRVVVTTDVLVEGRHFRRGWGTGADLGWRAAAQNLADVAAMGAVPTALVVGLVMPRDVEVAWIEGIASGLAEACAPHGVGVVGGDLSAGDEIVLAVTAHGDLGGGAPVLRSGARAGDVLALAGVLGRSAAGLVLLRAHRSEPGHLVESYLRPRPPLAAGPAAARAGAHAMMDVSDGLLRDAGRMARASGVRLDIDSGLLATHVEELAGTARDLGADPMDWLLAGGEDHGLLAAFAPGSSPSELPEGFAAIGRVLPAQGESDVVVDGQSWPGRTGHDHFAPPHRAVET